jgi:hypothetical protein
VRSPDKRTAWRVYYALQPDEPTVATVSGSPNSAAARHRKVNGARLPESSLALSIGIHAG